VGAAGTDRLFGGAGNDTLTGGAAGDDFIFGGKELDFSQLGRDRVSDFTAAEDRILLSLATFSSLTGEGELGNQWAMVNNSRDVAGSDAVIVYNSSNGNLQPKWQCGRHGQWRYLHDFSRQTNCVSD
jgi:Ca2+-binding RTX toxin-like protein